MILSPSYCFAEGWNLPFEPKILVREKSNYFDSVEIKSGKLVSLKRKVCKYILNLMKG
jgi:hypothetical protein